MEKLNIKPVSVNEAYSGRRVATKKLRQFKTSLTYLLKDKVIPEGCLQINIVFGFSSKASDLDNGVKAFLDVLQKRYNFNDNRVYQMNLSKQIVKKGSEFIQFEILPIIKELKY